MGQAHAALRTGAKFSSVLLSEQLTQINNYYTEGLLVRNFILFFFSPSGTCYIGQALQQAQLLPEMWKEKLQRGLTSLPSSSASASSPRAEWVHRRPSPGIELLWRCEGREAAGTSRPTGLEMFCFLEGAGNLKALAVLLGRCEQQNKLCCKRGHLGKLVWFPSLFWKALYTCTAVDFLNIK